MSDKTRQPIRAIDIPNAILWTALIFSQCFYLSVLTQKNITGLASYLAPSIVPPHIHEVLQNPSLFSFQTHHVIDPSFDVVQESFTWPIQGLGLFTGIGVVLTTLVFNFFNWIALNIFLLLLYLALLLSPLLLLFSTTLLLLEGQPYAKNKKSLIAVCVSMILLFVLLALIGFTFHSSAGCRATLFFGATFLMKDAGYYLNPVIYLISVLLFDYWIVKKLLVFTNVFLKKP